MHRMTLELACHAACRRSLSSSSWRKPVDPFSFFFFSFPFHSKLKSPSHDQAPFHLPDFPLEYLGHQATLLPPLQVSQRQLSSLSPISTPVPLKTLRVRNSASTCRLPSTNWPITWLLPLSKIHPPALRLLPPRTGPRQQVPTKDVGCTLGTSHMRPRRGNSKSSSRLTPCEY